MKPERKYRNSVWLREQYIEQQNTTTEIAEECGCDASTVGYWLKKHGIETRTNDTRLPDQRLTDREWLRLHYVQKQHSTTEIAEECGCSARTVSKYLRKHDIETRAGGRLLPDERLSDQDWLHEEYVKKKRSTLDIAEECGCNNTTVGAWLDRHGIESRRRAGELPDKRLSNDEWLREQYINQEKSIRDIAEECDCSHRTVGRHLDKHDIETRKAVPVTWQTGADHPNWKGGTVPYGTGWNARKRREVRERDEHTCQDPNCSLTQTEHLDKYEQKLHVHHLRKARDVDDPEERNAKDNLITLCQDCHWRWEKIADTGLVPQVQR